MKSIKKCKAFTLLELIIVMAIMAVLATIFIPAVTGYIDKANLSTDIANLRSLNSVSQLYRFESNPITEDLFSGLTTDTARMNALITNDYLSEAVVPKQKDVYFTWKTDTQQWMMENSKTPSSLPGVTMGTGGHKGYIKGSYTGSEMDLVMPLTLDGVNITNVYQDVFRGKGLTSLYFDPASSITEIHARAFLSNNLTEISLPNSVKKIDYAAFSDNPITKITIGSNVTFEGNVIRNSNLFRDTYYAQGPGTYLFINGAWVKQ